MAVTQLDMGRIVLFQATPEQSASASRRAAMYNLDVRFAASEEELPEHLASTARGVLVLGSLSPRAWTAAKKIRAYKGLKNLPVFAFVADAEIDSRLMKKANDFQVELLPESLPQARRWQTLRQANERARHGRKRIVHNRRAHFRLPLLVKAKVILDIETVDISMGGVAFKTNRHYRIGEIAAIDIRSLLGEVEEDKRGLQFEIVAIKTLKEEEGYRYLIGAKFVNLTQDASERLKEALELIEPTQGDE